MPPQHHPLLLLLICLWLPLQACGEQYAGGWSTAGLAPTDAERKVQAQIDRLTRDLQALLPYPSHEAELVARTAVQTALDLREAYDVTLPHWGHNVAVATGLAPRGKCCHWARDLMDALEALNVRDYDLTWGVAYHQGPFEHSSVVVTRVGQPFETGILLDGWRHAGFLYWRPVTRDSWPWKPHPLQAPGVRIDCSH